MTEAEWHSSTEPRKMLDFLRSRGRTSDRKLRLFAASSVRQIWALLKDERSRWAVEVTERFADGLATATELGESCQAADHAYRYRDPTAPHDDAAYAACSVGISDPSVAAEFAAAYASYAGGSQAARGVAPHAAYQANAEAQATTDAGLCRLLRDICGDPFRPLSDLDAARLARSSTLVSLAQAAYDDRRMPEGTLDPGRLGVLADALEEVGASSPLLEHLRSPGPHVLGCHGVDWVVGRVGGGGP